MCSSILNTKQKQHGGEVVDPGSKQGKTTKLKAFRGAGFVLGNTPGASGSAAVGAETDSQDPPREIEICTKF
ncbi:hypothetical protein JTE90_026378 [Oedothorax gibbosus]|uniref:Uncharacterized protein n=1 Tax=Oedothorax gibbosus TaxID=931172 RepID=A0AAV6VDU2_9ARAC|nr:hypothetical protein JTE90_026378 [Oedothorax gibbosus]